MNRWILMAVLAPDLATAGAACPARSPHAMMVAVTGASGLVGRALTELLAGGGHEVAPLVRRPPAPGTCEIGWDPASDRLEPSDLAGFDAVVHLAGEPIGRRWTARRKAAIHGSRVASTALLARALASLDRPPRVFVTASAVGYYGDRADDVVDETSAPGRGFLADVCRDWEAAAAPAREAGVRVVHARFGIVLSAAGGALAKMLPAFRLGLGGPIAGGGQWISWISRPDVARALLFLLETPTLAGAVNVTSPSPIPQRDFARALGRALHRPAVLPLPASAVSLLFGEMGRSTLLASQRAVPACLLEAGFRFEHADLAAALAPMLPLRYGP